MRGRQLAEGSILAWILPGFFLAYLVFFLFPVFLSASAMQFFQYIPSPDPIGVDLKQTLGFTRSWLSSMQTPYVGTNLYPPLASALFAPFLALDFASAYRALTLLTTLCYVVMTLVFPVMVTQDRKGMPAVLLVFMTGLFSYGFQFELERGQFDVISVFLAFLAIWICHYHSRYSILAYALFTISVQLKIYPFIFVPMLICDGRDWRTNIRRLSALVLVNFALLFALGAAVFMDFIHSISSKMPGPYIWVGNHSITAFTTLVVQHAVPYGWSWLNQYSAVIQFGLLFIVAGCVCLVWAFSSRREASGIDPYLLLACTISALLIPPTSNDYKLSILAAPVAILYSEIGDWYRSSARRHRLRWYHVTLVFAFSAAYASTLFSFVSKPATFTIANNFPALVAMLVAVTALSSLEGAIPATSFRDQRAMPPEPTPLAAHWDSYASAGRPTRGHPRSDGFQGSA